MPAPWMVWVPQLTDLLRSDRSSTMFLSGWIPMVAPRPSQGWPSKPETKHSSSNQREDDHHIMQSRRIRNEPSPVFAGLGRKSAIQYKKVWRWTDDMIFQYIFTMEVFMPFMPFMSMKTKAGSVSNITSCFGCSH